MEISAGILFIKDYHVLLGHATDTPKWDIPKGHVEPNETHIAAAIRECREETGFTVHRTNLIDLGLFDFSDKKKVALFAFSGEHSDYPLVQDCVCTSLFKNKKGEMIPEMDDYKYVPFDEIENHAGKSLTALLKEVLDF